MSAPRVGLVGARSARQGLGPYVARDLLASGVEVPCFLGTSEATLREAAARLRERCGLEARGYSELERMLERESLDALAILSPAETHERFLRAAASARLHVLCEKPLLWGGEDLARRARDCVEAFASARLLLAENCQWPFALPAFRRLHPGVATGAPRSFEMWLSPSSQGLAQLGDCLSHPLSVLQELVPGDQLCVENTTFEPAGAGSGVNLSFDFVSDSVRVGVSVRLRQGLSQPRAAGFAIDGARAERIVQMPGYTMELSDGRRSVELPDPLTARVAGFARDLREACSGGPLPSPAPLATRMALLEALVGVARRTLDESRRLAE